MLAKIIGACIVILIGVSIFPLINSQITNISATGVNQFLLELVPLFFALTILGVAITIVWSALNDVDILREDIEDGNEDDLIEYKIEDSKSKTKQTYKDFVKERLEVEKLMHD